jgi:DNA-binding MarR family transcriptional regulator
MNEHDELPIVPALERATHTVALWVDATLRHLGVSQAEAHVLAYLARHPGGTINDLHASFGHKRSTLTGILDRLEGRGWLVRGAHPTSRRVVAIALTEAGQSVAAEVAAALHGLEERVRARVGGEAMAAYLRVLRALEATIVEERR